MLKVLRYLSECSIFDESLRLLNKFFTLKLPKRKKIFQSRAKFVFFSSKSQNVENLEKVTFSLFCKKNPMFSNTELFNSGSINSSSNFHKFTAFLAAFFSNEFHSAEFIENFTVPQNFHQTFELSALSNCDYELGSPQ